MVLLILVLIWAAVLLPPLVRSRIEGNPIESIGRFRRNLRVLQSASPFIGEQLPETWAREAKRMTQLRRRRRLAQVLLGTMGTTLVIGLVPMFHYVLAINAIVDVVFVAYIAMLLQARRTQIAERAQARRIAAKIRAERESQLQEDVEVSRAL